MTRQKTKTSVTAGSRAVQKAADLVVREVGNLDRARGEGVVDGRSGQKRPRDEWKGGRDTRSSNAGSNDARFKEDSMREDLVVMLDLRGGWELW